MANVQRIIAWLTVSHLLVMFAVAPVRGEATGPPAFRGVLKADEYAARFEKALQALPSVQQLESSRMPLTGRLVIRILRGHQAEGLNIQVGDVLTAIDDHPIGAYDKQWLFRTDSPQTMRLVTRDGVERAFEIQPGLVGVRHVPYDRPDLAYIRRTDRVREVDEQVLVGIVSARTDPDLSETAWYHAVAGGYEPDALSSACGALIALCQGRSQTAAAYAEHVPEFNPDLPNPLAPRDRLQVAVASGRLDMLLAMSALEQEIVELNVDSIRSLSEEAGRTRRPRSGRSRRQRPCGAKT